eukprot:TRINITY_DN12875_c0_g1_i1.p1 TRINITY_DN12875_c0_g1~~TRINITY_DN12875_c0_g1_i1.p1  ORF type:complete len:140 (+),score=20.03 TRINITY_DN12875_c0_g1_i1:223-642(+)
MKKMATEVAGDSGRNAADDGAPLLHTQQIPIQTTTTHTVVIKESILNDVSCVPCVDTLQSSFNGRSALLIKQLGAKVQWGILKWSLEDIWQIDENNIEKEQCKQAQNEAAFTVQATPTAIGTIVLQHQFLDCTELVIIT